MVDLPDTMVDIPVSFCLFLFFPVYSCFFQYHLVSSRFWCFFLPVFSLSFIPVYSRLFPFYLVFPVSSSLFFRFNSMSSALIALALFKTSIRIYLSPSPLMLQEKLEYFQVAVGWDEMTDRAMQVTLSCFRIESRTLRFC